MNRPNYITDCDSEGNVEILVAPRFHDKGDEWVTLWMHWSVAFGLGRSIVGQSHGALLSDHDIDPWDEREGLEGDDE